MAVLYFIILCAITIPGLSAAGPAVDDGTISTVNKTDTKSKSHPGNCTEIERETLLNYSIKAEACFIRIVHVLEKDKTESTPGCSKVHHLDKKVGRFLNATNCTREELPGQKVAARKLFKELVEFSIKDDKIKDFIHYKGVHCVNVTKEQIEKCVQDKTGNVNQTTLTFRIVDLLRLNIVKNDLGFTQSIQIRDCVIKALKKTDICNGIIMNFVSSLFVFVSEQHGSTTPSNGPTHSPIQPAGMSTTYLTLLVVSCVIIVVCAISSFVLWRKARQRARYWDRPRTGGK